jgi:hypothetical protein
LERKPTPAINADALFTIKSVSQRRHRRSCHGTVLDDEQQGGTAASRSCRSLAHDSHSNDGMAFVVLPGKVSHALNAGPLGKDVSSRQQSDQQQHHCIAHHLGDA